MKIKHLLLVLWFISPFMRWLLFPIDWKNDLALPLFTIVHSTIWFVSFIIIVDDFLYHNKQGVDQLLNKKITLPKIKRKDAFLEHLQKQYKEAIRINDKEEMQRLERSIDLLTRGSVNSSAKIRDEIRL